jgi:hypothetical protein
MMEIFKVIIGDKPERMDSSSFDKLSPEGRKLWRQLSHQDRSTMLGSKPETPTRSANVTEMMDASGDDDEGESETSSDTKVTDINKAETKGTARAAAKSTANPGDIRRSMSGSAARGGSSTRAANSVAWGVNETRYIDEDVPANDDLYGDDDSDEDAPDWPAFEGSVGDYWQSSSSSDEEDFP